MAIKVVENSLSTKDIQEIVEIIKQKRGDLLNKSSDGRTNTTISVSDTLKQQIDAAFGFTLPEEIPISMYIGDTTEHVDCTMYDNGKTSKESVNTYVLNLTTNVGQFKIEDKSYPLKEGTLYMFSGNTTHSTINTGDTMRLSIGACNEKGQYRGLMSVSDGSVMPESESDIFTNTVVFENRNIVRFDSTIIADMESNIGVIPLAQLNIDNKQLPLTNGNYIQYPATSSPNNWVNWYTDVVNSISASAYVLYYTDTNGTKHYLKFNNENYGSGITENIEYATVLEIKTHSSGLQYFYIPTTIAEPEPAPAPAPLISNICFPSNTPITTDQGIVSIDKINTSFHTIHKKPIVHITKTKTTDKYLICFKKNSLGMNSPNQNTVMSKHHKVVYKGQLVEAYKLVNRVTNVTKIPYKGELLYNVLMEKYSPMVVNNLTCETLHPNNLVAKLYTHIEKIKQEDMEDVLENVNKCIEQYNSNISYNKVTNTKLRSMKFM